MLELPQREAIALHPRPINCRVSHVAIGNGQTRTAIAREWYLDDSQRCRLCPDRCHASMSPDHRTAMCLITAHGYVSLKDAELFSPVAIIPGSVSPGA